MPSAGDAAGQPPLHRTLGAPPSVMCIRITKSSFFPRNPASATGTQARTARGVAPGRLTHYDSASMAVGFTTKRETITCQQESLS